MSKLTVAQKHELLIQFNQQRGGELGSYSDMKATYVTIK